VSSRRRSSPHADRPLHRGLSPQWRGQRLFYVVVEGESTEPDYLRHLNHEFGIHHGFFIHPVYRRNGLTPAHTVSIAITKRAEVSDDSNEQVWVFFDRDEHRRIPEAVREAEAKDIRVGFSHPSFDLWLLLHFTDVSGEQGGSSSIVHEKLRRCEGFGSFDVHNDKSITGHRAEALKGRHEIAVKRAKRLVDDCPTNRCSAAAGHASHCDPLRRDPSTDVWRFLVALGVVKT
jgi:hypothetical protein